MYLVRLASRAKKELKKLPRGIEDRVPLSLSAIAKSPLLGKPLKGILAGAYSVYIWPYRIVYAPFYKEKVVIVLRVRRRKDMYR